MIDFFYKESKCKKKIYFFFGGGGGGGMGEGARVGEIFF